VSAVCFPDGAALQVVLFERSTEDKTRAGCGLSSRCRLIQMLVRMTSLLAAGWLTLVLPGHVAAQAGSNAAPATCGVNIENQKADALEATCLRKFGKLASREGDLLTLRLENGGSKTYRDDAKACDSDDAQKCAYYRFAAYHPKAQVYSIWIQYYEGSGFELLSARTGNVLRLSGTPYFSRRVKVYRHRQ